MKRLWDYPNYFWRHKEEKNKDYSHCRPNHQNSNSFKEAGWNTVMGLWDGGVSTTPDFFPWWWITASRVAWPPSEYTCVYHFPNPACIKRHNLLSVLPPRFLSPRLWWGMEKQKGLGFQEIEKAREQPEMWDYCWFITRSLTRIRCVFNTLRESVRPVMGGADRLDRTCRYKKRTVFRSVPVLSPHWILIR